MVDSSGSGLAPTPCDPEEDKVVLMMNVLMIATLAKSVLQSTS